jgi:Ser/Thr protein kinase RdoA (MazF antagonist)
MAVSPKEIASQFSAYVVDILPLGNGFINDTFQVITRGKPFVLQRINTRVFPHPEHIMANLESLSQHIAKENKEGITLTIPQLLDTHAGSSYTQDQQGDYWRAWDFIENSLSLETLKNIAQARQVGFALGQFHRLTQSLTAEKLFDTLPGFHIAPNYFQHYEQVKTQTNIPENAECASFIEHNRSIINDLESAKVKGLLTVRTIHGDPKLNNFLFDNAAKHVVSLVDLDTVKPGLLHYDIGDCLRSCCHIETTNEFSLNFCKAVLESYLREMGLSFSKADYQMLYPAIRLIPFELGLRFYTDYLEGNRYFKVAEPEENLQRAISQFRLCANIIRKETDITGLIGKIQNQV